MSIMSLGSATAVPMPLRCAGVLGHLFVDTWLYRIAIDQLFVLDRNAWASDSIDRRVDLDRDEVFRSWCGRDADPVGSLHGWADVSRAVRRPQPHPGRAQR